ncbi:MAG: hypothetical protein HQM08_09570 [Candidatus Riflebacteria bacterium]|nr:hypothetical protein [Candidatus Riflebacteria bacterium]
MGIFSFLSSDDCPECKKLRTELEAFRMAAFSAPSLGGPTPGLVEEGSSLGKPENIEGTVVICDVLWGATYYSGSPESIFNDLQAYTSPVCAVAQKHGGAVDRFNLFEIQLFFRRDGHAVRALQAAFELRGKLAGLPCARSLVQVLSSGVLLVGSVGNPGVRLDFSMVGSPLFEARAMKGENEPLGGTIRLGVSTYEAVQGKMEGVMFTEAPGSEGKIWVAGCPDVWESTHPQREETRFPRDPGRG